uniref:Uncharacterized protein n=1 Tax=Chromera velia CCMP2878 TaxID=1169474 RepID=A0A0G4F4D5_9ALVE|eukprot:Cvel_15044.t1-p1 / transcript=Cvel_15044.t1 / gene=Cvel_15044 / organism=Chromera_velia_CCMP2878 / gene_product=hypothetical protein / transcript_product=hypothetical protein / location=Cvel_scaffold1095:54147-55407(-) / protein_length=183 / sequence_SO=supercontig / SO=protein_coding / is_pseudo=false
MNVATGGSSAGAVGVYFGKSSWSSPVVVSSSLLDGVIGFRINGQANNQLGREVAGNFDVNNDGIKDILMPAFMDGTGTLHVFFGKSSSTFSGTYSVTDIDGSIGFSLKGVTTSSEGSVDLLEETPCCSFLHLFMRCTQASSGIVGLDIKNALPVTEEEIACMNDAENSGDFLVDESSEAIIES